MVSSGSFPINLWSRSRGDWSNVIKGCKHIINKISLVRSDTHKLIKKSASHRFYNNREKSKGVFAVAEVKKVIRIKIIILRNTIKTIKTQILNKMKNFFSSLIKKLSRSPRSLQLLRAKVNVVFYKKVLS